MKKSIKYAGIAAATLLAVAPVAAPVLSTTAQAAVNDDVNTPSSEFTTAKNKFAGQFTAKDADKTADYSTLTLGQNNAVATSTFNTTNAAVIGSPLSTADATKYLATLDGKNVTAYMTATDAKGNVYDGTTNHTAKQLDAAIKADDSMLPVTFTVYTKDTDINGNGTDFKQVAQFKLNKSDEGTELKSINAKFTTPITVAKKSKTALTQLVSSTNVALTDQDGEAVSTTGTTIGKGFYKTYKAAMDAAASTDATADGTLGDDIKDGEFKNAGTYYQLVNFTAGSDTELAKFIANYNDDPSSYTVYVNGKKASSGYDFTTTDATISFVRAINVSDSEADWTTEDTTGVVTTKSDSAFYTLKDDNNNTVSNRALAKNTAWKTNAVRTDQDGNKQYRVGASEWINANDVTFSDKATDNNGEGAYTDVKALNGKVTTAGPEGFYYPLYDDNGKMVTNRGVAGLSAWYTDKSAVNANGDTVYHVATGEWLQGNNVTYTAY
ncbi:hypothetical protein [Companilactobacillus nantensis]|uniref:Surface layer protein A domain-containing protein n=1 Tax=Companilactobacillus nantensis DSM 16982 TaxID=1423774 RepID=A0A0R1WCK8_9LACO|nr:hypothetical protein [Companilactobacillus nantensis]KRM15503.1 hypothetical protein FD31_GL001218 [Companilactobacillus nantensis DSM 16982]GEO64934.1 hypothetical protein LNA01_21170 [Companilactobacillus nantensis]